MNIFNASPTDAGCFYKDIPLFSYLLCQVVNRLNGNIFCDRSVITPILSSATYVRITSSIHEPSPRPQPANRTKYFICFHLHNSRFANDFSLISIAYKATYINAFFMVNQRPFYERRFALPVRLPPCAVLHCMGRPGERRTAPCGFQISCSPCPGLRRSGGSIAGALPQMLSAAF